MKSKTHQLCTALTALAGENAFAALAVTFAQVAGADTGPSRICAVVEFADGTAPAPSQRGRDD